MLLGVASSAQARTDPPRQYPGTLDGDRAPLDLEGAIRSAVGPDGGPLELHSTAAPSSPGSPHVAYVVGAFTSDDRGVSMTAPRRSRNYVIPAWSGTPTRRLMAEIDDAPSANVALLFRARTVVHPVGPDEVYGYGFFVDSRRARVGFVRFDGLSVRDPGARVAVPELADVRAVYVLLMVDGGTFTGLVYDLDTHRQLAAVAWSDASYTDGGPGLYLHRRTPATVAVQMWTGRAPLASPARPVAVDWLVRAPSSVRLPATLAKIARPLSSPVDDERAWVTSEAGALALTRAGLSVRVQPGVPYLYRRPEVQRNLKKKIWRTSPGIRFLDGLKTPELVERHLVKYAERFPKLTRLESLGKSHEGRDIWALTISRGLDEDAASGAEAAADKPSLLLCAAHHADEASTPEFALDAARYLLENRRSREVRRWLKRFRVVVVPMVNPDGSHAFWHVSEGLGRTNRRPDAAAMAQGRADYGVDLNRNYPFGWANVEDRFNSSNSASRFYRGPGPASEPEVQAMLRLAERERFVAMISFHAAATKILVPYTVEGAEEPARSTPWALAEQMVDRLPATFPKKRYEAVKNLYPVGGVDQDWFFHTYGTQAFLIEVPASAPSKRHPLEHDLVHTRPAWQFLLQRYLDGPSLEVSVVDPEGRPLSAAVSVVELGVSNGERWTSDPARGLFRTYLDRPGRFTVRVEGAEGAAEQTIKVRRLTRTTVVLGEAPDDEPTGAAAH